MVNHIIIQWVPFNNSSVLSLLCIPSLCFGRTRVGHRESQYHKSCVGRLYPTSYVMQYSGAGSMHLIQQRNSSNRALPRTPLNYIWSYVVTPKQAYSVLKNSHFTCVHLREECSTKTLLPFHEYVFSKLWWCSEWQVSKISTYHPFWKSHPSIIYHPTLHLTSLNWKKARARATLIALLRLSWSVKGCGRGNLQQFDEFLLASYCAAGPVDWVELLWHTTTLTHTVVVQFKLTRSTLKTQVQTDYSFGFVFVVWLGRLWEIWDKKSNQR